MKLFLDSSVVLAACGRATGASRAIFEMSQQHGWTLQTSSYVISEVTANLPRLDVPPGTFDALRTKLESVPDVVSFGWAAIVAPAKDRPILFTAAAWSDVLLTLDRHDFIDLLGAEFYGFSRPGISYSSSARLGSYDPLF